MDKQKVFKLCLFAVLVCLIIITLWLFRDQFNLEGLRASIEAAGIWAPLVFIAIYILATVLFLPGLVLTVVGGLLFGPWLGTLYNISAAVIGASIAFLIARYLAADWVRQKAGPRLQKLLIGVDEEGWRFVAVMRLVPLFPFNLLNYALGLTKIRLSAYIVASAIFMLPGTFAYTYLGSLGEVFINGEANAIITQVAIAIGLLVLVAYLPFLVKKIRHKD